MAAWETLFGVFNGFIKFGKSGPIAKNNNGAMDIRNAADDGYATLRAGAPSGDDDVVNKAYFDANSLTEQGSVQSISVPLGTNASETSTKELPANAYVLDVQTSFSTAYPAGTLIEIGTAGTADLFLDDDDHDPTDDSHPFSKEQLTGVGGSAAAVVATLDNGSGGAPASGAGVAIVFYTLPNT